MSTSRKPDHRKNPAYVKSGSILSVSSAPDHDHGCHTFWFNITFDEGGGQGFGGWYLGKVQDGSEKIERVEKHVCQIFGVSKLQDLVGKRVKVLYNWPEWNCPIEGLICEETNAKFTSGSIAKIMGQRIASPLERKRGELERDVASLLTKLNLVDEELENLDSIYCDWEAP